MPNVSVYLKGKLYRQILAEAERKGVTVSALVREKVEGLYGEAALSAERAKIRPGVRE